MHCHLIVCLIKGVVPLLMLKMLIIELPTDSCRHDRTPSDCNHTGGLDPQCMVLLLLRDVGHLSLRPLDMPIEG